LSAAPAAVDIAGLSKTFPGQRALRDVSLTVDHGEVHGLLGENGSGKSTLIKVLSGFHEPDPGADVLVNGMPLSFGSAASSSALGLRFVHQNLGIIPEMTAVENLSITTAHRNPVRRINRRRELERTTRLFERFGVDVPTSVPLGQCRPVDRTVVAIVRALDSLEEGGVLVLDEPTAALPPHEVDQLFTTVRDLRSRGIATIYVSHRLDELFVLADRVSVLRDGVMQGTRRIVDIDRRELVRLIVGSIPDAYDRDGPAVADAAPPLDGTVPRLVVQSLRSRVIKDISFELAAGEIVGVAGLTGSGREELASALVGAIPSTGTIRLDGGPPITAITPRRARDLGLALVPGNRGAGSAIAAFDVRENITLPSLGEFAGGGRMQRSRELAATDDWIKQLDIRPLDPLRLFRNLSGGNQQKAILAKWFNIQPNVIVLDDPTAGVDVGARQAIYDLIRDRAELGTAIIVSSADHEDLLALCTRVLVLHDGRIGAELRGEDINAGGLLLAQNEQSRPEEPPA
jgi:ribose transport system ATP-binding protein